MNAIPTFHGYHMLLLRLNLSYIHIQRLYNCYMYTTRQVGCACVASVTIANPYSIYIQWNLQKTDSPYFGNLHNADKWLRSQIIPHSLLYLATPNYALKSRSNGQNQYKFPSENG